MILKKLKISHKQMLVSSLLGLGILFIVSFIGYNTARRSMQAEVYDKLTAIRAMKKTQIQEFFEENVRDIRLMAQSSDILNLFHELENYHKNSNPGPDEPLNVSTSEYRQIAAQHGFVMDYYVEMRGYRDIYLLCKAHGHVMYSFEKKQDLGTNLSAGPYRDSPLAHLWQKVVATQQFVLQDFAPYRPTQGAPVIFLGGPLHSETDEMIGVLVLQISVDEINRIMQQRDGLGQSGEAYLVGPDFLMRSDSFLDPVNRTVVTSFQHPETGKVQNEVVQEALAGATGAKIVKDYRDVWVLSAYSPVDILGNHWALLVEVDRSEAFRDVYNLRKTFVIWGIVLFGCVLWGAIWFARSITRPLNMAVAVAKQISQGNLQIALTIHSEDEVGQLLQAMQTMTAYIQEVADVANKISQKDLQVEISPQSEYDVLNHSLKRMVSTLQEMIAANRTAMTELEQRNHAMEQQNWLKDGISQLSSELAGETSLLNVCRKAVTFTARYVNAGQGCLYVYDAEQEFLKLQGTFAFTERNELANKYSLGEGIVGQVALERTPILLKHVSPEESLIVSGTVAEAPLNTYTFPLLYENELYGVLEVASFEIYDSMKQEFFQEANRVIATALFSAAQRERSQELLQMAQQATQEAEQSKIEAERRAEEAREANIRLEEQQQKLQQQNEEFQQMNAQLEEQRQQLEQQREELRQQKEELLHTKHR